MFREKTKGRSRKVVTITALGLSVLIYCVMPSTWNSSAADRSIITKKAEASDLAKPSLISAQKLPVEESSLPIFLKEGWSQVDAPPPNEKLLELSPELLAEHSQELYEQLSSGAIGPRHIDNMATLFAQTQDEKIRYRILENLGNLNLPKAEKIMISLFPLSTSDEKAMLIGLLHPLEHQTSHSFLVDVSNDTNAKEQNLGLTALASVYIFSGNTNFQRQTLSRLSASARIKYDNIQKNLNGFTWAENKRGHIYTTDEGVTGHE